VHMLVDDGEGAVSVLVLGRGFVVTVDDTFPAEENAVEHRRPQGSNGGILEAEEELKRVMSVCKLYAVQKTHFQTGRGQAVPFSERAAALTL
jgi:hypothetical protein